MRIEAIALLIAGCASSSIESDIDRVRELTRAVELAAVADVEVDPTTTEDVRKLLNAGAYRHVTLADGTTLDDIVAKAKDWRIRAIFC